MRQRLVVLFGVLSLMLGCHNEISGSEAPIVRGTPSPSDDAVVFVIGSGFCSGTLIAPRVVLTAKHCVVPEGAPGPLAASRFTVGIGERFPFFRTRYSVERVMTTPGPLVISSGPNPVGTATGSDVALLILSRPVTGVTPIPVRRAAPDDLVGQTLLAVGFGNTEVGGSGSRMQVDAVVSRTTAELIEGIEVICSGDSGGPLFVTEDGERRVVGVASFGVYADASMVGRCPADADYWNRVDIQLDLIDRALRMSGECVVAGDEVCNGIDDDCDGTIDAGCAGLGETCSVDEDCAFAPPPPELAGEETLSEAVRCVAGRCTLACDAREPIQGCASIEHPFGGSSTAIEGFHCQRGEGCDGTCVSGAPGSGAVGSACNAAADCQSLVCEYGVCSTRCVGDTGVCPVNEVCVAEAGECGICAGPANRPTARGRAEPCTASSECTSGFCGRDGRCSLSCALDEECGAGFRCQDAECVLGVLSQIGEYCMLDADCAVGGCGALDGARFCGARCDDDAACGGRTCAPAAETGVCAPDLGGLGAACGAGSDCASGLCRGGTCAVLCSATHYCPLGTECVRDGAETVCRPPTAGGCSAGRGRGSSFAAWGALAVLGWLARRRSR